MTFLCEYNVNTATPWKSKLNKSKEVSKKKEISQQNYIPFEKLFSKNLSEKPNKENHERFENNTKESKSDVIMKNEIKTKIEGEDNGIEVIANKDSSIILSKKDVYKKSEKLKSDNVSWSIFEMLKNVIKMPFKRSLSL